MADENLKMLLSLVKLNGNSECADCKSRGELVFNLLIRCGGVLKQTRNSYYCMDIMFLFFRLLQD